MPTTSVTTRRAPRSTWIKDLLGLAWVLAAAGVVMAPALAHGTSLGPFDIVARVGLSRQPGVSVHNPQSADLITEMIPWTTLAWTQVHHGHLPLWNPYSALGMPLAFNWQSATFSLPSLLGYLAPLHLAYTVQVLTTLVIAGTGVYVLGRVMGLGVPGCVMAGTVYELSGPFFGWLGWPVASVMAWAGWLFAAAILVIRGHRRAGAVAFFAVVLASALYSGQPDAMVLLGLGLAVFVTVVLALRAGWLGGAGPVLRPVLDLALAVVAGAALGAPLLLPGLQLTAGGIRTGKTGTPALPLHDISAVIFQGFDGLPVAGSRWFGHLFGDTSYLESATYVGVIAVVLAVVAVALRHRHPEVLAMSAVAVVMGAIVFFSPLVGVLDVVPYGIRWHRGAIVLALALAVLAGVGTDVLIRSHRDRAVLRWAGGGFAILALFVAMLWLFGRGSLPPADAAIRRSSFVWPTAQVALGLVVVGLLALARRQGPAHSRGAARSPLGLGRGAGAALLVCETAFLITAGAPLWSSSSTFLVPTPAEVALADTAGSAVVGFGAHSCEVPGQIGIPQNVNVAYDVHELDVYDPITPKSLFRSWEDATGTPGGLGNPISVFCPAVTSATEARRFGVAFVLEPPRGRAPGGAVFERRVGDESLYKIPGAAEAILVSAPGTSVPSPDSAGRPVAVTHPDPRSWKIETDNATEAVLRLHLTDVPGWHATIDGRPLRLDPFSGAMLQARIPAGRHTVELRYWPGAFSVGLGLALCSVAGLSSALGVSAWRRRRMRLAG